MTVVLPELRPDTWRGDEILQILTSAEELMHYAGMSVPSCRLPLTRHHQRSYCCSLTNLLLLKLHDFIYNAQVFEDSFHQLRNKDMRGKLVVHFQNEEGIDAGGVSREWFQASFIGPKHAWSASPTFVPLLSSQ